MANYRFTIKSEEIAGAGQPNIIYMGLASDSDAAIFQSNLELLCSGKCVTVDKEILISYELNYPSGTNLMFRIALMDAAYRWQQVRFYNVQSSTTYGEVAALYTTNDIVVVAPVAPGTAPDLTLPPANTAPALVQVVNITSVNRTVSF